MSITAITPHTAPAPRLPISSPDRRQAAAQRNPTHDPHWHRRRALLDQLADQLQQLRLTGCSVQSWDLLQATIGLLAKAERKHLLNIHERQRALDWAVAAISHPVQVRSR